MNAFTQVRRNDQPIYLDYQATTPMDPRVLEAMMPYFTYKFGNPHSRSHSYGWEAEEGVEKARGQVARLIGADEKEVIFTSGATESNNLAIRGVAEFYKDRKNHIVTTVTEHKCVLDTCRHLEQSGFEVTYLPVQKNGLVDLEVLRNAITDRTVVVSIMAVNNEIGVIQPLEEIGKICREKKTFFQTDGGQAAEEAPGAHAEGSQRQAERHRRQRRPRAAHPRQPQHQLRLCRGRIADDGHQGPVGVVRLGLHLGLARAQLRPEGARCRGGHGAHLAAHRARPLHHRAGSRHRGRRAGAPRQQAAGDEPALADGPGRHRHQIDRVGRPLRTKNEENVMSYSEKLIDHYENPRNIGTLDKNSEDVGTGLVGAPACGDVMKLQIKVGADGLIEDAKFKTFGCGSAIASSSPVTEWVKGKTIDEAEIIKNTDIAKHLALPPVKIHCSVLAEDAIKAAVEDYKKKHAQGTHQAGTAQAGEKKVA